MLSQWNSIQTYPSDSSRNDKLISIFVRLSPKQSLVTVSLQDRTKDMRSNDDLSCRCQQRDLVLFPWELVRLLFHQQRRMASRGIVLWMYMASKLRIKRIIPILTSCLKGMQSLRILSVLFYFCFGIVEWHFNVEEFIRLKLSWN